MHLKITESNHFEIIQIEGIHCTKEIRIEINLISPNVSDRENFSWIGESISVKPDTNVLDLSYFSFWD